MPKISVIIPIYNSGKYLEKCLSSVMNQSFTDFEVIMINDGSKDNSSEICKKYVSKDGRFKYFYKENGGESSARNRGLKEATGEYVFFVDSDDYIELDCLEKLCEHLSEDDWDIVQCGMNVHNGNTIKKLIPPDKCYYNNEFIKNVLCRSYHIFLFIAMTTKLYKKELLDNCGLSFDENVKVSLDCLYNTQLLPLISKVRQIDYVGYNYIQDNSTATKAKVSYNRVFHDIRIGNITSGIRNSLISKYNFESDPDVIKGFHTAICIIYISNAHGIETSGFSKEEKKKLYESYFSVMNYPVNMAINDYSGTDRKIIEASAAKDAKAIERIYKLREIKSKIKFW